MEPATYTSQIAFTARGNAVGFTSKGESVVGRRHSNTGTYTIWIDTPFSMIDSRTRKFDTLPAAREYAASLVDENKTTEMAWW